MNASQNSYDPVLFHTHGIGPFDFSSLAPEDLTGLDALAEERRTYVCPTVYLKQNQTSAFHEVLQTYRAARANGQLSRIVGFALEGPVLGPRGGTPRGSTWQPTATEWRRMATWCGSGVRYMVLAPDAVPLDQEIACGLRFADLLGLIYDAGGRIAVGHFCGTCPIESAQRLEDVLQYLEGMYVRSPYLVLTDHLFNDMPRAFRHAFRTPAQKAARLRNLRAILDEEWSEAVLPRLLGPVPAALLVAAKNERLTPSLNFDGGHVDLDICKRVVEYLGAGRLIAITDHTEVQSLAGEVLHRRMHSALLYRGDGIVAAGSLGYCAQRENMRYIGLDDHAIRAAFSKTPLAALHFAPVRA